MSESMAIIRQKAWFFRMVLMYQGAWSTDHGTVELPWNFFFGLETAIYKNFLHQRTKSSTVPSLFFLLNKKSCMMSTENFWNTTHKLTKRTKLGTISITDLWTPAFQKYFRR